MIDCDGAMRAEERQEHEQGITNCWSLKDEWKFGRGNESWHSRCWELLDRKPSDILSRVTLAVTLRKSESWGRWIRKAVMRLLQNIRKKMARAKEGRVEGVGGCERRVFVQWNDVVRIA